MSGTELVAQHVCEIRKRGEGVRQRMYSSDEPGSADMEVARVIVAALRSAGLLVREPVRTGSLRADNLTPEQQAVVDFVSTSSRHMAGWEIRCEFSTEAVDALCKAVGFSGGSAQVHQIREDQTAASAPSG